HEYFFVAYDSRRHCGSDYRNGDDGAADTIGPEAHLLTRLLHHYPFAQSSQARPLTRLNSLLFAVTKVILWRTACPEISRSYAAIGRPIFSRAARIVPALLASSSSKGSATMGPAKNVFRRFVLASFCSLFS